jgi:hypothetical protein
MATAPAAIWALWYRIEELYNGPGLQDEELAGIVGDRNHSFGFHLSYNDLRSLGIASSDYSLQPARNMKGGKAHPDDASALDVHFGPKGMITVTKRLIASAQDPHDHRLDALYEFCGTTNGTHPHPFTVYTGTNDPNNTQGWDSSHDSHVHLSIMRDKCNDEAALLPIADVIAGIPLTEEFTVDAKSKQEIQDLIAEQSQKDRAWFLTQMQAVVGRVIHNSDGRHPFAQEETGPLIAEMHKKVIGGGA